MLAAVTTLSAAVQPSAMAVVTAGVFDATDAHLRAAIEDWGVPGTAYAIVERGEVVHLAAFGTAGQDGRAMTADTPIVIGSVGKSITALAVAQLVAAGRVDLAEPVARYIPDFTLAGPEGAAARITVRSLLEHTSGLSTADGQDSRWYRPGLAPADVVRGLTTVRADGSPGSYAYSNLNYVILGTLVEAASGESYGDYVQAHIFGPLGMGRSYTSLEAAGAGSARGHRYLFGVPVPFDEPYPTGMVAAGYQVSTARDMAAFVAALANGGLFGGVDIVGPRSTAAPAGGYGTDWQPASAAGVGAVIGQSGSTLSSNADILVQPDRSIGVVVLLNANPTQLLGLPAGAADLALDILRLTTGGHAAATAPSVRAVYLVVDGALIMLLLLFILHVVRARTWRRRYSTTNRRTRLIARTVAADLVFPATVLVGLPLWIGSTGSSASGDVSAGWAFALWTLPDISWTVLALALGCLALGAAKLLAASLLHGATPADQGRVSGS